MKKTILAVLVIWSNLVIAQSSNDNYLCESKKISDLAKNSDKAIVFIIDANGLPAPADQASIDRFNQVFERVVRYANEHPDVSLKTKAMAAGQVTAKGSKPSPGAGGQPMSNVISDTIANSNYSVISQTEIRNELLWILFLKWDNNSADYQKVIPTFPSNFSHLDIIAQGIANEKGNQTGFAFSESAIIYGVADFVIKKAKQELIETYLSQWYTKASSDEIISKLAPQTLDIMQAFMNDHSLNITKYGDKWKAAFQEDLRNVPVQLQDEALINSIVVRAGLTSISDQKQIPPLIAGGDEIVYNLYLKKHLVNILNDMSNKYLAQNDGDPAIFKQMIVLANVLLISGGKMEDNKTYQPVALNDINRMDVESWRVLLKLIYLRQNNSLSYVFHKEKIDVLFNEMLSDQAILKFNLLYKQTISFISSYQSSINALQNEPIHNLNANSTRQLFDLSFQLLDQVHNYLTLYPTVLTTANADYEKYIKRFYAPLSEIGEGISTQQYAKVLDGTAGVLTRLNNNKQLDGVITFVQVYGSFMINILDAKGPDDVENALDELIPDGQYQLKNTKRLSVSISAYPGGIGCYERIKKYRTDTAGLPTVNQQKVSKWSPSVGFYLPIGIDFNLGCKKQKDKCGKKKTNYSSTNILLQVADLGAVLNYRITADDSTVSANPNITLKQILAPGISVMRHLNNSPVVYGMSLNYTPDLRTINQSGNIYQSSSLRAGVFIAVDVTFINYILSKRELK
jgi:hypothetical protein